MSETKTLTFDHAMRDKLAEAYLEARKHGLDHFEFQNTTVLTDYAKYLLEFLEIKLGPSDVSGAAKQGDD